VERNPAKQILNKQETTRRKPHRVSSAKAGLDPGELTFTGRRIKDEPVIHVFDYSKDHLNEKKEASIAECKRLKEGANLTWIDVEGIHDPEVVKAIGRNFGTHPLVLEDILNLEQRTKVEDYKDQVYIIMKMVAYNVEKDYIEIEQVSLLFGDNFVISLQEGSMPDVFEPVKQRLRKKDSRLREQGTDALIHALVDIIVDNYYIVLEKIGEKTDLLDEELIRRPHPETLEKIYELKREVIYLRKCIWPLREVINILARDTYIKITEETRIYFRDIYDHTVQAIETVETLRDIISGMMDLYLSSLSNKMNEIMKSLTMIGLLFIPLTFIAGIYGMNFEYMPELKMKTGYPITLGVMLVIAVLMIFYFRRKGWIGKRRK
jgi:magnesium transporter